MKKTLLIAEDEEVTLALLRNVFERSDLLVHEARTGEEALQHIDQHPIDVILTDLKMPGADGLSVLTHARKVRPGAEVILMTGHASVETAVRAMKLGAFHYITKPFDIDEVAQLVDRAFELTSVRRENVNLRSLARGRGKLEHFIGMSDATKEVLSLVRKVADTDSTVLITGESGTGKELIARALHYLSPRADRMLVPINCSAIPAELLESELFGHVKGAFTGAHATRAGKFEAAHAAGEASPGAAGEVRHHRRGKQGDPGGRARHHRDQQGSRGGGLRGEVPRRSLLPSERDPHPDPAAPGTAGRHPPAG